MFRSQRESLLKLIILYFYVVENEQKKQNKKNGWEGKADNKTCIALHRWLVEKILLTLVISEGPPLHW